MSCFFDVFLENTFSCTWPCFSPLFGAYVPSNRDLFFIRIHSDPLGGPNRSRGGPSSQFDGPLGSPRCPLGGPRGADLCSHAGETLVFPKSERFACTRAPVGSPGGHWGTLGATFGDPWAALGRPSGCLGALFVDLFASRTIHNTSVDTFGGGIAPNLIQD
jgi:hypothetical protein